LSTRLPRRLFWLLLAVPCVALGYSYIGYTPAGAHLKQSNANSLTAARYTLAHQAQTIAGIEDNASGITFNPDTGTLFVVVNSPEKLVETDRNGHVLRHITLTGFHDTEGVVYLGNEQFAIIEERRYAVVIVNIDSTTTRVDRAHQRSLSLPGNDRKNNKGLEGLTADIASNRLFIVNEKKPRQLLQIDGFIEQSLQLAVYEPWQLEGSTINSRDFAGLHFNAEHNSLLLLSDESKSVIEVDSLGNELGRLQLKRNSTGLTETIPQPEGITMDDRGSLYIISEPNLFYRFDRPETTPAGLFATRSIR
jgi:uncharacterized protein YjiK